MLPAVIVLPLYQVILEEFISCLILPYFVFVFGRGVFATHRALQAHGGGQTDNNDGPKNDPRRLRGEGDAAAHLLC